MGTGLRPDLGAPKDHPHTTHICCTDTLAYLGRVGHVHSVGASLRQLPEEQQLVDSRTNPD